MELNNIGIVLRGPGLGDNLITLSLPENFYKNTGFKLIDVNNHFLFDYNPYIQRNTKPDLIFTNSQIQDGARSITDELEIRVLSIPDRHRYFFNLPECYLRHPRLYRYEDSETIFNKVCVHIHGNSRGQMDDKVINIILENYKRYDIFQVGSEGTKDMPNSIDIRGSNFWETVKHISESAIFIGIDSSPLHIADCFPKVIKKYFINYFETPADEKFKWACPMAKGEGWWEFNRETYNPYERDIGATMSYLKI